jgi:hypothetical protein
MGSGYFLVEATEYIARFLVDRVSPPTDAGDRESDLAYWKRRVVQNCVYGVDINPLAVDLAKLSLWLATAAKERPLSFLDHHLRTGNALVGARISETGMAGQRPKAKTRKQEQAAADAGQLSMLDDETFRSSMSRAVDSMWLIERNEGNTVQDVKDQERLYETLHHQLRKWFGQLADLMTARAFDPSRGIDDAVWNHLVSFAMGRSPLAPPQFHVWIEAATRLAERERFFHWDLEFPEIFFDRFGRPLREAAGFDAVIGNPPYVRQERIAPLKPYLRERFASFHSVADLYIYFYERGIKLLRPSGKLGFISSGTFARANFAKAFRAYLPTAAQIDSIIDFGENQPFEGAEMVRPSIVVLEKGEQRGPFMSLLIAGKLPPSLDDAMNDEAVESSASALQHSEWTFQPAAKTQLAQRIFRVGYPLQEVVGSRMYRGLITGLNQAFIIDDTTRNHVISASPSSDALIKHLVTGQDLRPWYSEDEGRWLIRLPAGWTREAFGQGVSESEASQHFQNQHPALAAHLEPYADAARRRYDQGEYWWELRACDYYESFDRMKIVWPDIAKLPRFSLDEKSSYLNNTAYFIPTDDPSLLGILQSRVTWYAISQKSQPLRERAGLWQYRLFPQFLEQLPIPDTDEEERGILAGMARTLTDSARARYTLHRNARHRILSDLGTPGTRLNQKLTAWWDLDFPAFRAEVKKALKREIPLKERDDWEAWLAEGRAEHERLTEEIIRLETDLNARVYDLFDLSPADIRLIEESTKYRYGEV